MKIRFSDKLKGKRLLILVAVLLLTLLGFYYFRAAPAEPTAPTPAAITYSTDTPDETKPDKGYEWKGAPNDPKYIKLPTINAEGFVQNVGVDQKQEIAVPNNIHVAGWFVDSLRPGERGLSIIDGHLNGRNDDGIFINLQNIKKDDVFTVELGDGSTRQFKVTGVVTVDRQEAVNVLFSQHPQATHQLNLITCGGNYDRNSRLYDKRIIVTSELVP